MDKSSGVIPVPLPLRIELGQLARQSRVWIGDTEITGRVASIVITADVDDEPTRVVIECIALDGDKITLVSPVNVEWDVKKVAA